MGNTSSSTKSTESRVDHGYLTPHGIYTGSIDWNQHTVANLILERRLAPFYRPLEDYDPTWDEETILANRKGPEPEHEHTANDAGGPNQRHGKGHSAKGHAKDVVKPTEAQIYRDAVECPICFMVNIRSFWRIWTCALTSHIFTVLSTEYQPLSLLLSGHLHRMLRPDQA
jgi:hypothetical protein